MATLLAIKDKQLPMPSSAVCISPWVDLTCSGQSLDSKKALDPVLTPDEVKWFAKHYLGSQDPKNPQASPLFGDFKKLPSILIQVGSHEVLLDDALRLAEALKKANIKVELRIWDEMIHVWHLYAAVLPEGNEAIGQVSAFLEAHLQARGQGRDHGPRTRR